MRNIARRALERGTGARGIRAILEQIMLDIMYDMPSRKDVRKYAITDEIVNGVKFPWPPMAEGAKTETEAAPRRRRAKPARRDTNVA